MTLYYIILAVVVIGIAIYLFTKKKGPKLPRKPEGPATPPTPPAI